MCDNHTWMHYSQYQGKATKILRTMLKCYLCLTLFLQFALINAAKTRRGIGSDVLSSFDAQEHVHIKVHIPDITRLRARPPAHRSHHQHEKPNFLPQRSNAASNNKKVLPTLPTHSGISSSTRPSSSYKEIPYEFPSFDFKDEDNSLPITDLMYGSKYGPVVFTSNIQSGTSQQPMSQQFMRQLFSPEIMSALKTDNENNGLNLQYPLIEEPNALDTNDMMEQYFQKLNQPTPQKAATKQSNSFAYKRKKYGNTGIGEAYPKESLQQQFYNAIQKQHSITLPMPRKNAPQRNQRQQQKQQHYLSPPLPPVQQNFKAYQNDFEDTSSSTSDELEAAEDVSSTASTSASIEDTTTVFNALKPISYHDMYGEYATPITTATTSSVLSSSSSTSNRHYQQQQPGFSLHHETIPTYTNTITTPYTANSWFQQQSQQQRPEKQQQILYKPHHQQQQQQQLSKKHKPKSQQTQFVLKPSTFGLATSPTSTSAASLSSSSLSTSPISSGFIGSSNGIGSPYSSTWSIPYDFVQQSYQQQLAAQQQQPDYKLPAYKKHKNRTKRKRNRIIVE